MKHSQIYKELQQRRQAKKYDTITTYFSLIVGALAVAYFGLHLLAYLIA
jgi:hypothetical protein